MLIIAIQKTYTSYSVSISTQVPILITKNNNNYLKILL